MNKDSMITFSLMTIKIRVQEGQNYGWMPVEVTVAQGVGLAYIKQPAEQVAGWPRFTLTHIASGTSLCDDWYAETEEEAQDWIRRLDQLIDWTANRPVVRAGSHGKLLRLAIIGALCNVHEQEES
jgi:hypothetical protein